MIGDITSTAAPSTAPAQPAAGGLGGLGPQAFLNLLVAQLRYQNPMSPSDPSAMLQQTASFTQVETMQRMAAAQQQMLGLQRASIAADMVGKEVTAEVTGGAQVTGVVDGVRYTDTGPVLLLGDRQVTVESVTGYGAAPAAAAEPT
jgi:flagellar basal-body rod modification protein FlgD